MLKMETKFVKQEKVIMSDTAVSLVLLSYSIGYINFKIYKFVYKNKAIILKESHLGKLKKKQKKESNVGGGNNDFSYKIASQRGNEK